MPVDGKGVESLHLLLVADRGWLQKGEEAGRGGCVKTLSKTCSQ